MNKLPIEIPMGECMQPGCDIPLRMLCNYAARTLTVYHGEDALGQFPMLDLLLAHRTEQMPSFLDAAMHMTWPNLKQLHGRS